MEFVDALFTGLLVTLALYSISFLPMGILLTLVVFLVSGCCIHRSWHMCTVYVGTLLVIALRLDDCVQDARRLWS
eukprot:86324-Rhodomonas_salina.2